MNPYRVATRFPVVVRCGAGTPEANEVRAAGAILDWLAGLRASASLATIIDALSMSTNPVGRAMDAFDWDTWTGRIAAGSEAILQPAYEHAWGAAAGEIAGQIPADLTLLARAWANTYAGDLAKRAVSRDTVKALVTRAVGEGWSVPHTAAAMRDWIGLDDRSARALERYAAGLRTTDGMTDDQFTRLLDTRYTRSINRRATTMARTELMTAANQGRLGAYERAVDQGVLSVDATKVWVATESDRTCDECSLYDGDEVGLFETFDGGLDAPPAHPSCFIGDTPVTGAAALAGMRRRYLGPLLNIETRSGHRITVTPNHPLLTPQGWVAAGLLHTGSYLASTVDGQRVAQTVDPHHHQVPASIEQAVASLGETRAMPTVRVPSAAEQFHGDGGYGDVDVVAADRLLVLDVEPERRQESAEQRLARRSGAGLLLAGRHRLPFEIRRYTAAGGLVCRCGKPIPLRSRHRRHAEGHRSGPPTRFDAALDQAAPDRWSADAKGFGESLFALTGLVTLDQIVHIDVRMSDCHVYNLQTTTGWYIAGGVVAHNCRCTIIVNDRMLT